MRPDWEKVVTPVIDYALTRPEIDPERIVLVGWSLGGFLAPRAAAFEHRIAALIADPGQGDQRDEIVPLLPLDAAEKAAFPDIDPHLLDGMAAFVAGPTADPMLRWKLVQRGQWVHGTDTLFDTLKALSALRRPAGRAADLLPDAAHRLRGDPTAAGGAALLAALTVPRKDAPALHRRRRRGRPLRGLRPLALPPAHLRLARRDPRAGGLAPSTA